MRPLPQGAAGIDLPEHRRKIYPDVKQRLDFKSLGCGRSGGVGRRFYITLGRGRPPR